ncbi:MAG: FCD domain-containing protein, partial [Planctomycetota bacterium]|nr:FCD domain-containing protein [Planctomycetota bacterium]
IASATALDQIGTGTVEACQREVDFHLAIARLVENEEFIRAYERVMRVGLFLRINQIASAARFMSSHVALVEALCQPDPESAARAVRAHIRAGREALFARLSGRASDESRPSKKGNICSPKPKA